MPCPLPAGFFLLLYRLSEDRYLRIRTTQVLAKPHCEDVEADLVFHQLHRRNCNDTI